MRCRKCRTELPDDSRYCLVCGVDQKATQNPKSRGNGQGSVYQLPNKTWMIRKTLGYERDPDGKLHRKTISKSGFRTKREAVEYMSQLKPGNTTKSITFHGAFKAWEPTHKAGKSTMDCYRAAMKYFSPVWHSKLEDITVDDLQECLDDCPKGKRTRENMKALCGLIYKYGIPRNMVPSGLNMGQYLVVGAGDVGTKEALPDAAVGVLEANVGKVQGADYVLCQCYLGFRPSEFLALDTINYNRKEKAFVGGAKTDAGKDRVVTVSPKIQPVVDRLVKDKVAGPVFCADDGSQMDIKTYRSLFYKVLEECGVENPVEEKDGIKRKKYTPHSCRHTFATLMKRVPGADKDKLALIGHTSTEMLRHYQDVPFEDLRKITDAL